MWLSYVKNEINIMYEVKKTPLNAENEISNANLIYPFNKMKAGDSFFIPDSDVRSRSVASSARAYSKRHGIELKAKRYEYFGEKGILVFIPQNEDEKLV